VRHSSLHHSAGPRMLPCQLHAQSRYVHNRVMLQHTCTGVQEQTQYTNHLPNGENVLKSENGNDKIIVMSTSRRNRLSFTNGVDNRDMMSRVRACMAGDTVYESLAGRYKTIV